MLFYWVTKKVQDLRKAGHLVYGQIRFTYVLSVYWCHQDMVAPINTGEVEAQSTRMLKHYRGKYGRLHLIKEVKQMFVT